MMNNDTTKSLIDAQIDVIPSGTIGHSSNATIPHIRNPRSLNLVARRLPNGEEPNSKNTLQSFESSSYPKQVTSATAIINTGKPSSEASGTIVTETEGESTELSGDDPILEAIAAPVLEEAEAILFENEMLQPENPPFVVNVDLPPMKQSTSHRKTYLLWSCAGIVLVVVATVVAVTVSCTDGRCRRQDTNSIEGEDVELLSPTPSPMIDATVTAIPTGTNTTRNTITVPTLDPTFTQPQIPSSFPTSIDTTIRANLFIDYINEVSLAGRPIRNLGNGTPEDLALHWLITSDPWSRVSLLQSASERFRVRQRYALSTLFFQQHNQHSTNAVITPWTNTSGWLVDVNECNWYGINCTTIDFGSSDINNNNNNNGEDDGIGPQLVVMGMYLQHLNIIGTIPPDLGLLSNMEGFELYDNHLFGTIPASIEKWTNLHTFYVFKNDLTGTLPFSIGQWSNMRYFSITFNELTGTLPTSIVQWTNLLSFSVFNNQLNGTIPDAVGQWTNLDTFVIRHNSFTGTLPSSIGQWTVLRYVNVTDNALTGTIPASIGQWTLLQTLSFRDNYLTGPLPSSIGSFTNMWYFDVASNLLTGTIPVSIGNWSSSDRLKHVAFESNNLTGLVPIEFCNKNNETELVTADCLDEVFCECCTGCF